MKKAVLFIACMASTLYGDVVYSNITDPNRTGTAVTNGRIEMWEASAFIPASDATFTSASARLLNLDPSPATINFALYSSGAPGFPTFSLPGTSLATLGAVTLAGSQEGVFTLGASSPLVLLANIQYWLVLSPGTGTVNVDWEAASIGGGYGEHPAAYNNVTNRTGWV